MLLLFSLLWDIICISIYNGDNTRGVSFVSLAVHGVTESDMTKQLN